ncbi:LysR family transcriptional regulator [Streptomyces mirabilis]|uniref:LysR family transcriptional regulator n=1 Tax=Streptomyces mirabilis TaxID=68239 RepID=UPI003648227D
MIDLRQLEVVVSVARAGGLTAAARRLHVVQSAASSTTQALERELGTPLFDRTTHRVALTAGGEAFVPAAHAPGGRSGRGRSMPYRDRRAGG